MLIIGLINFRILFGRRTPDSSSICFEYASEARTFFTIVTALSRTSSFSSPAINHISLIHITWSSHGNHWKLMFWIGNTVVPHYDAEEGGKISNQQLRFSGTRIIWRGNRRLVYFCKYNEHPIRCGLTYDTRLCAQTSKFMIIPNQRVF